MNAFLLAAMLAQPSDLSPLSDCDRFPCREDAVSCCSFNLSYRDNVEAWGAWEEHRRAYWWEVKAEVNRLYCVWDTLRDAQNVHSDECYRRKKLEELRELLGEEAYQMGQMPACVPLGAFRRIE